LLSAVLVHVVEAQLLQQAPDDPQHRLVVVDDEDRHLEINGHLDCSHGVLEFRDFTGAAAGQPGPNGVHAL
jgi:hypothetical protein